MFKKEAKEAITKYTIIIEIIDIFVDSQIN